MRTNRVVSWLIGAAAVAAVLLALGMPVASLWPVAFVLACPLMMVVMMRGMAGMAAGPHDHRGHGCEHDRTRRADPHVPTR